MIRSSMIRSSCLILALLTWLSANSLHCESRELPVDWLFLIDTSQSMVGKGGSANIFPQVQRALKTFVRTAKRGDSVAIYTFDSRVLSGQSTLLGNEDDKRRLIDQIDNLQAEGLFTHTGEAFYSTLVRQEELHPASSRSDRKGFIVLFTDGVEDTRDHPGASRIEDIEIPPRNKRPYSIFVWLGEDVQEFKTSTLAKFSSGFGHEARVLLHPKARDIDSLAEELRHIATQEARNRVELNTMKVDFGTLESKLGAESKEREISVYSDKEVRVGYEFDDPRVEVATPAGPLNLIPGDNQIPFTLKVSKEGDHGHFKTELGLYQYNVEDAPTIGTVAITYSIEKPSYFGMALIGLLSFGALAIAVYRFRTKSLLFGVLDITSGASPSDTEGAGPRRIDLSGLKSRRTRLAHILDLSSAGGDVELSVGKQENGERVIRLSKVVGSVALNDKPLEPDSVEEIYNEDRLTLDDRTTIRYSGPERPEPNEELRQAEGGHSR